MNRTDYSQPSRVRNAPLTVQTDAGRAHSWDAMRRATPNREAKEAWARALGVSVATIEKQQRPYGGLLDTGRTNTFQKQLKAINESLAAGVDLWDAIAGHVWIFRKLGLRVTGRGAAIEVDPHRVVADVSRHSGDLAAYIVEAMADDVLDLEERKGIQARLELCIRAYIGAEAMAEVQAK